MVQAVTEMDYRKLLAAWRQRMQVRERKRLDRHADALLTARRLATKLLREEGATRVYLFGTALLSRHFRHDSDIDLAVEGIPSDRFFDLWARLERECGFELDLVRLEWVSDKLYEYIKSNSEVIGDE